MTVTDPTWVDTNSYRPSPRLTCAASDATDPDVIEELADV